MKGGGIWGRLAAALFTILITPLALGADRELNLFAWSEYIPQSVLDGFTAETGIAVHYETFSSGEEMLAKLLAGASAYDLIQPPDYIAEALIKNGLLRPLDFSRLPHFANILPRYQHLPFDPTQAYTIPYMAGISGIVYNSAKVTGPIRGFRDMFSGRYRNRIVVIDDGRELVTAALYTLGYGTNEITPETLEKVRPLLAQWFAQVKLFDSDSPKTALLNGDADVGFVWCGEAAILLNQDPKFRFVLPIEGVHASVDVLAIPRTARHPDAALRLMDYILRPEVSKLISDAFPYTNPNGAARRLLTPPQRANAASYPVVDRPLDTFRHIGRMGAAIDELVTDLKKLALMQVLALPHASAPAGRRPGLRAWLLLCPMLVWLAAFVIAPTAILLVYSFCRRDDLGRVVYGFTWENYGRVFAPVYLRIFLRSIGFAAFATALCALIGFPAAWYIARRPERARDRLLLAVMIPFWTSFLIRTYAWIAILKSEGLLNGLLLGWHLIATPFDLLYTPTAVMIGLVYAYLPFMILPIYGCAEQLDGSLLEAAHDLGAGPWRTFREVILPLTWPGVAAGTLLVFVPAIGMFAVTDLMGGARVPLIGNVIQNQFLRARNWPFGSALGVIFTLLFVIAYAAIQGRRGRKEARP